MRLLKEKLLIVVGVGGSLMVWGYQVENTLKPEILARIANVDGKVFVGKQKGGSFCNVVAKKILVEGGYGMGAHIVVEVVAANVPFPPQISSVGTRENLNNLLAGLQQKHQSVIIKTSSAGWCSNCGGAMNEARTSGFNGQGIEFYMAGTTPQITTLALRFNSSLTAIAKATFLDIEEWYIPIFNFSPKRVIFACNTAK